MLTKFAAVAFAIGVTSALPVPTGTWPESTGVVQNPAPLTIKAGEVFDGKMQTYERSDITCQGQKESGKKDAVFLLEPGATLKNVIIGKNQMEGVHCDQHDCVLENVWWDDVCEDAFSVKGGTASSVTEIRGGGARYADDKVIQHNGLGKVIIDGFFAQDFGKLYRSCGTCGAKTREVEVSNVYVVNPKSSVVTVNVDNNDKATLKNVYVESTKKNLKVCAKSYSTDGAEPTEAGSGADGKICIFEESDIHLNQKPSGSASNSTTVPTTVPSTTPTTVPSKTPSPTNDEGSDDDETPEPVDDDDEADGDADASSSPTPAKTGCRTRRRRN
ncbi:hypothetical protein Poli38472_011433 [Pythium oligandrum]|uniref:Probable pectate lyase F n=1 Tax=Pythium oligandrum TaxID=41045 RepID=A0A8K1CLI9_PYTOL|nr:hypothetical protein Poli38472_011433 [Pythium oligandrum]|eukprot:TMW64553.1 hypothetical protein Poli38472_011433 [Pythium oligandrum]